jgi:hypothetical protein
VCGLIWFRIRLSRRQERIASKCFANATNRRTQLPNDVLFHAFKQRYCVHTVWSPSDSRGVVLMLTGQTARLPSPGGRPSSGRTVRLVPAVAGTDFGLFSTHRNRCEFRISAICKFRTT